MRYQPTKLYLFNLAPVILLLLVGVALSTIYFYNKHPIGVKGVETVQNSCVTATQPIKNGGFESGKQYWSYRANGGTATYSILNNSITGCVKAAQLKSTKGTNGPGLTQGNILLDGNKAYYLVFSAKSNVAKPASVYLRKFNPSTKKYSIEVFKKQDIPLGVNWEANQVEFTTPESSTPKKYQLEIRFPPKATSGLDNVYIIPKPTITLDLPELPKDDTVMQKKVFAIIYDPVLESKDNQTVSEYARWKPYPQQIQEEIAFFKEASDNTLQFSVVEQVVIDNWLTKLDGFAYTDEQYLEVLANDSLHHEPDTADYYQFLNDPELDICGKYNRGEIDEVWLFGGPWYGFHESAMATNPNYVGFNVNGPTYNQTTCNGYLPVGLPNGHTFGHRLEATISYAFGSWAVESDAHRWNWFAHNRGQSTQTNAYGCGSVHFAPNSSRADHAYEYDNPDTVNSFCEAFGKNSLMTLDEYRDWTKPVSCQTWGCNSKGYEMWWWKNIPRHKGVGPDGKLNNWWKYTFEPNMLMPSEDLEFTNLNASMPKDGPAVFSFDVNGNYFGNYTIHAATSPSMEWDIYLSYAIGQNEPIVLTDPKKWDKYECGRTLYWRVVTENGETSPITGTTVCEQ